MAKNREQSEVSEEFVELQEEVVSNPKKNEKVSELVITAFLKTKDQDGNTERKEFVGKGVDAKEALANLEGFPAGVRQNTLIKVERGDIVVERAVASQKAEDILVHKDALVYESVFRGV